VIAGIYLIGLAVGLCGVILSLGWTFGTRHDDGSLLLALLCCVFWPLFAAIVLCDLAIRHRPRIGANHD
jgi:drug/metabolite transporter (DMT)-like permease